MSKFKKLANTFARIGKGMSVSKKEEHKMRQKPGGSNVGHYEDVEKKNFAGPSGGSPQGSYPINTLKRAKAALAYAHNAPNPQGIKNKVYNKYPELRH